MGAWTEVLVQGCAEYRAGCGVTAVGGWRPLPVGTAEGAHTSITGVLGASPTQAPSRPQLLALALCLFGFCSGLRPFLAAEPALPAPQVAGITLTHGSTVPPKFRSEMALVSQGYFLDNGLGTVSLPCHRFPFIYSCFLGLLPK